MYVGAELTNNLKWNCVNEVDVIGGLKQIESESVDCVLLDPPYNIGYDFGNNKCKKEISEYVKWSREWVRESTRILKPSGTMFVYGFSEILAHLSVTLDIDHRWLIWHYTNKTTPSSKFWQRTHESIICAWKSKSGRVFNIDDVREPYTDSFIKGYKDKGRKRPSTSGRFGKKDTTVYKVNEKGALPRDVLKISALAGGSGAKSRISYCSECDEVIVGNKEAKLHHEHKSQIIKHPTQKPFELTRKLFLSCMPKHGKIVVPFAGTGSECMVAKAMGHDFVGIDLNPDFVKMANLAIERGIEL